MCNWKERKKQITEASTIQHNITIYTTTSLSPSPSPSPSPHITYSYANANANTETCNGLDKPENGNSRDDSRLKT